MGQGPKTPEEPTPADVVHAHHVVGTVVGLGPWTIPDACECECAILDHAPGPTTTTRTRTRSHPTTTHLGFRQRSRLRGSERASIRQRLSARLLQD